LELLLRVLLYLMAPLCLVTQFCSEQKFVYHVDLYDNVVALSLLSYIFLEMLIFFILL